MVFLRRPRTIVSHNRYRCFLHIVCVLFISSAVSIQVKTGINKATEVKQYTTEMFNYTFPCGPFKSITNLTSEGISFDPPVTELRYCAMLQILEDPRWTQQIKKVAEFGVNEMRFFQLMRRNTNIEHILQIDIDADVLERFKNYTNPLISDYLNQRPRPLRVEVLHGDVAAPDDKLLNSDAVIGIELLEHLHDDELSALPANIFHFIQPKLAAFSTPNSDYNVIFKRLNSLLPNGFRHLDHKFEWTQEEFKAWALSITKLYRNYVVSIIGVGVPPEGQESIGFVSQIAVFVRKDLLDMPLEEPLSTRPAPLTDTPYKSLHVVEYPFHVETRSPEEIKMANISAEITLQLHRFTRDDENYNNDEGVFKMPLDDLLDRTRYLGATKQILEQLLDEKKLSVENDYIIVEYPEEDEERHEDDYFEDEEHKEESAVHNPSDDEELWTCGA